MINLALTKSRRNVEEEEEDTINPDRFALIEEIEAPGPNTLHSPAPMTSMGQKSGKNKKRRRMLDPQENVYLVQLGWKGSGKLIMEEKDERLLREFYQVSVHHLVT